MITTEGQEFEILRARVERLERRMRVVVAGWVLSVAAFVFLGVTVQQAASQPETLRARRIEVMDAAGQPRIRLAVSVPDGSPQLTLLGAAGQGTVLLTVFRSGPVLGLADAAGQTRILLGVFPSGSGLLLKDAAGRSRIELVDLDRLFGLSLKDAAEKERIGLYTLPDGSPRLSLYDAAYGVLFRAP